MISVIVPIYNTERYLTSCIESICRQTYENLEIILIDDGSTDSSLSICRKFEKKDSRIKVYTQDNSGVSAARNLGIKNSHGDFITFVDSDDIIEKNMYEILLKNIKTKDYDISSCLMKEISIKGKVHKDNCNDNIIILDNNEDIMKCFFENFMMDVSLNNKLFKRECIAGVYLNEKIKINEDKLFLYFILKKTNRIIHQNTFKYYYYKHLQSASTQNFSYKYRDIIEVAKIIEDDANRYYPNLYESIEAFTLKSFMNYYRIILKRTSEKEEKKEKRWIRREIIKKYNQINIKIETKRKFEINLIKISEFIYKNFLIFYDYIIK